MTQSTTYTTCAALVISTYLASLASADDVGSDKVAGEYRHLVTDHNPLPELPRPDTTAVPQRHCVTNDQTRLSTPSTEVQSASPPERTGFIDLNGYYDSRKASGLTINLLANLPASLQYFSLTNYVNPNSASSLRDQEAFYTEQNLRWSPHASMPLALTTQWVVRSGEQNDAFRLGAIWKVSKTPGLSGLFKRLGLYYHVNVHAYQFDFVAEDGWRGQLEHVYQLRPFKDPIGSRFYVAGFMDHNLWFGRPDSAPQSRILTEHQLGARLYGGLHAVAELRYNQHLGDQRVGVGLGLQYLLPFALK